MALQSHCSVGDTEPLPNPKRSRSYDGDYHDRLEELEKEVQSLRELVEILRRNTEEHEIRTVDNEAELMQVRTQLEHALKARAKLADLEFDIFSPTIIRKKVTKSNFDRWSGEKNAGLVEMIPTEPHGEERSYRSYGH